jgi:hypothetical protein
LTQSEEVNTQLQNELVAVTDKMKMTQGEVTTARRQNGEIRDDYSKKLTSVQSELATKANAEDLKSLGGDISGVKSDLESTKSNLDMTRTEFGTLIARNHDEIDQLRRIGERDYFEFTLTGKGNRSKVGDLMVELRGTNVKKNQFTVALYVDDMLLYARYSYASGVRGQPDRQRQSRRIHERPQDAAHAGIGGEDRQLDNWRAAERKTRLPI